VILARAARSGPRSIPANWSSAARWALAVQVDHVASDLGEVGHGCGPAVDVGPRPSVGGDHPGQHDLVGAVGRRDEQPAVDPCLGCSGADHGGVGAPADEQLDRLDEHRLAGPGLAGERRQPPVEDEHGVLDHPEVLDVQFGEHGPPRWSSRSVVTGR
jgi:hypothetical protein